MFDLNTSLQLPKPEETLPGRSEPMSVPEGHVVLGTCMEPPYPEGFEVVFFAMGCFWGAERKFWLAEGVYTTAVGYAGGVTPNPTYEEVCSGLTGHAEVVMVVFDPSATSYPSLLKLFWEGHDPTQGMRQGNDLGTQYRSALFTTTEAHGRRALESLSLYQPALSNEGWGTITTTVVEAPIFYYAEAYHQQYLAKNPSGYCGLGGTGIICAIS